MLNEITPFPTDNANSSIQPESAALCIASALKAKARFSATRSAYSQPERALKTLETRTTSQKVALHRQ